MRLTIRRRLTIVFVLLSVSPLLLLGGLLAWQSYTMQHRQALSMQREIAKSMSVQVTAFFAGIETELRLLVEAGNLRALDPERQRALLASLCAFDHALDEVMVLDAQGMERVRYSRLRSFSGPLASHSESEEFLLPMSRRESYYGPISFAFVTAEPIMSVSVPLMDARSGRAGGVLLAVVRIKRVWDLIGATRLGAGQDLYIVDSAGRLVAHRNPSLVLRRTEYPVPVPEGMARGLEGRRVVVAADEVLAGDRRLIVVAEQRATEAMSLGIRTVVIAAVLAAAATLVSLLLGLRVVREIAEPLHEMAAVARRMSGGDLSGRVPVRSGDEIGVMAEAFNSMAAQVRDLVGGLEVRVVERTAQLEASNKELEAFSYSVSHDLRAPLRAVDGFSRILIEDYAPQLSADVTRLLGMIRDNSRQMGELIDDLLSLSRLGRQSMRLDRVDMGCLVHKVVEGLERETGDRRVEFVIGELPPCTCDAGLMRQVWTNLLTNAVKFTRTREVARVEVGADRGEDGRTTYFVKDNGVGFDMKYAAKLFGVFQRFHGGDEFEGTGIGLSIVQRIISRHGGKVWADAEVGRGAAFYFAL